MCLSCPLSQVACLQPAARVVPLMVELSCACWRSACGTDVQSPPHACRLTATHFQNPCCQHGCAGRASTALRTPRVWPRARSTRSPLTHPCKCGRPNRNCKHNRNRKQLSPTVCPICCLLTGLRTWRWARPCWRAGSPRWAEGQRPRQGWMKGCKWWKGPNTARSGWWDDEMEGTLKPPACSPA